MRWWLAPGAALLFGCVSDVPAGADGGDGGKQTGEEGGPCFSDHSIVLGQNVFMGSGPPRTPWAR